MNLSVHRLQFGLQKPLRALHISDTHLLFPDRRDNEAKFKIAMRRYGEFQYTDTGRNLPWFLDALQYAKDHCDLLLHTGDLIDCVSYQTLEVAQKLLALSGVDYFMCAGNHEYTHYSGQHPETPEERAEGYKLVPPYFRNDLFFASRIVNGLNLIALDNGNYQFTAGQLMALEKEIAKGYPMILLIHNPLYTPGLAEVRINEEGGKDLAMAACPREAWTKYPQHRPIAPNAETEAFLACLRQTPQIKAVLAGHIHLHRSYHDVLWGDTSQYVAGCGYYGHGAVFEIF